MPNGKEKKVTMKRFWRGEKSEREVEVEEEDLSCENNSLVIGYLYPKAWWGIEKETQT